MALFSFAVFHGYSGKIQMATLQADPCVAIWRDITDRDLITSADVNERAAYGHTKERRVRVASFCASGNNKEFLTDDTGNRRTK